MKIIITESYNESCEKAAEILIGAVKANPAAKLGLATGGTPVPVYKKMIDECAAGNVSFAKVSTVNLDEYCELDVTNSQSYRSFMDDNLFSHIDIDKKNTYVANGNGDLEQNCKDLDAKVIEGGVPDVQLLGIGNNGHIAFNEAADFLVGPTHIEELTQSTIAANARFFESASEVPTKAITMGMTGIMAAKHILLVATGDSKAEAIAGLIMSGNVTPHNPSTFLKLHQNVTIIIDKELNDAAKKVSL